MFALLLSSSRKISSDMIKASSTGAFTFVRNYQFAFANACHTCRKQLTTKLNENMIF